MGVCSVGVVCGHARVTDVTGSAPGGYPIRSVNAEARARLARCTGTQCSVVFGQLGNGASGGHSLGVPTG